MPCPPRTRPPAEAILSFVELSDAWAAVHVTQPDFRAYAVLEGAVELSPVAARPDDDTVTELVAYYRALSGEHEDWDDYRAAMVAGRRAVVRLTPDRAYGMLNLPG